VLLFSAAVRAVVDGSVSIAVVRLVRLVGAVEDASALAEVAVALGARPFEACLVVEELFEADAECAGLLVACLPGDDDDESEEPASAAATPQPVARATPTPKKTASPPTRPTNPEALII
jgi:hypothetical protein